MLNRICCLSAFLYVCIDSVIAQSAVVWKIRENNYTPSGMALAPDQFSRIIEDDFIFENRFILIGHSNPQTDWPI